MIATLALRQTANHHRGIPLTASLTGNRSKAGPQPGSRALSSLFQAQSYGFLFIFDQAKHFFLTFFRYFPQKRKAFCSPCACPPQWSADGTHPAHEGLTKGRIVAVHTGGGNSLKSPSALSALALSMAGKLMAGIEPFSVAGI